MKKRNCYIAWAVLFAVSATLGFIPEPEGVLTGLMVTVSLLFFVPPAILLIDATRQKDKKELMRIIIISAVSLGATMLLLIANVLSVGASETVGNVPCQHVWMLGEISLIETFS